MTDKSQWIVATGLSLGYTGSALEHVRRNRKTVEPGAMMKSLGCLWNLLDFPRNTKFTPSSPPLGTTQWGG